LTILLKYFKNLPPDLITICRYCTFLDIYILQGSVAWCACHRVANIFQSLLVKKNSEN